MMVSIDRSRRGRRRVRPGGTRWWTLAGVKLAVKDYVDVAGLPSTAAAPVRLRPDRDAASVAAARARVVLAGRTRRSRHQAGRHAVAARCVRDSRCRDDWAAAEFGPAVAVAARGEPTSPIGTDTAGSGRISQACRASSASSRTVGVVSTGGVAPACRVRPTASRSSPGIGAGKARDRRDGGGTRHRRRRRRGATVPPSPSLWCPPSCRLTACGPAAFDAAVAALTDAGARIVTVDLALSARGRTVVRALVSEKVRGRQAMIDDHPDAGSIGRWPPSPGRVTSPRTGWSAPAARCSASASRRMVSLDGPTRRWCDGPAHPDPRRRRRRAGRANSWMGIYTNFVPVRHVRGLGARGDGG